MCGAVVLFVWLVSVVVVLLFRCVLCDLLLLAVYCKVVCHWILRELFLLVCCVRVIPWLSLLL